MELYIDLHKVLSERVNERDAEIFMMWSTGTKQSDIAKQFDLSPTRIGQILDKVTHTVRKVLM